MKNEKVRKNVLLSFKKSKIYSKLKNLIKSPNWQVADKLYFTSTVEQSVNLKLAEIKPAGGAEHKSETSGFRVRGTDHSAALPLLFYK